MTEKEIWMPVPGHLGYEVSNLGGVRSYKKWGHSTTTVTPRYLKQQLNKRGYYRVWLCNKGKQVPIFVHGLVLLAFVGPCPSGLQVCHNNGVKLDNRLSNLRYDTAKGNSNDYLLHNNGKHYACKLSDDQIIELKLDVERGVRHTKIAKKFNMNSSSIDAIVKLGRYGNVKINKPNKEERNLLIAKLRFIDKIPLTEISQRFDLTNKRVDIISRNYRDIAIKTYGSSEMYPFRKSRLVYYWDCGLGHEHESEDDAKNCMVQRT